MNIEINKNLYIHLDFMYGCVDISTKPNSDNIISVDDFYREECKAGIRPGFVVVKRNNKIKLYTLPPVDENAEIESDVLIDFKTGKVNELFIEEKNGSVI